MLKDRKFWSGFLAGAMIIGGMAFLQPLRAADQDTGDMKKMMTIVLDLAKSQRQISTDLTAIKSDSADIRKNTSDMTVTLKQLSDTQASFRPAGK